MNKNKTETFQYVFTHVDEFTGAVTEFKFNAAAHSEVTQEFIRFLRGVGFCLPSGDGHLSFDEDEAINDNTKEPEEDMVF